MLNTLKAPLEVFLASANSDYAVIRINREVRTVEFVDLNACNFTANGGCVDSKNDVIYFMYMKDDVSIYCHSSVHNSDEDYMLVDSTMKHVNLSVKDGITMFESWVKNTAPGLHYHFEYDAE